MTDIDLIERVMDASGLDPAEFGGLFADATVPCVLWVGDKRATDARSRARARLRSIPGGDKLLDAEDRLVLEACHKLPPYEQEQVMAFKTTHGQRQTDCVAICERLRDGQWHAASEFKQPTADTVLDVLRWAGIVRASDTGSLMYQWK